MEQHTELMQISEVTPEFLREFAQSTNSFYQSVEEILEGLSECRIRYGVDTDNNTITFGTLDSEKYKNGSELSVSGGGNLIFGELRVLVGGNLENSLFNELEYALDTEFGISFERIARDEIQQEKSTASVEELRTIIDNLRDKVNAEFESFIADMKQQPKQQPPKALFEFVYEITWKSCINQFIANEDVLLSYNQLNALLSSKNTLDEIYEQWCQNGELHSYDDIQIALDDTANHILLSLERSNNAELTAKPQEKATTLVNGELKELPAVFDSQGKDITFDFLKETVNTVTKYHNQRQDEDKDPVWQFAEYEDLPSTSLISRLPPFEVEDEIRFNADSNQIEMSQAAFDWFEQYAPKHNDVSALEGQLLKHMRALDALETYELADTEGYRWSSAANLDETAEFKKERLQDFAKKHSIELSSDKEQSKAAETEKQHKLSLSERIDKARAENPRVNAPKQVQQRSNSSQEL